MLVRLLYCSRAVQTSPEAIDSILAQARQHNPVSGITGILCYGGGIFLQCIEGGRMQVSDLFGSIQKDARHKDVALLHQAWVREPKKTVGDLVKELSAKTGENIQVRRFVRYQLGEA